VATAPDGTLGDRAAGAFGGALLHMIMMYGMRVPL